MHNDAFDAVSKQAMVYYRPRIMNGSAIGNPLSVCHEADNPVFLLIRMHVQI